MQRILFLVSGTGGTQALQIIREYVKKGNNIQTKMIAVSTIVKDLYDNITFADTLARAKEEIDSFKPDCILTETSSPCDLLYLTLLYIKGKYYTVSIQDVWDLENTRYKQFEPDLICAPTPKIYQQLLEHGHTNSILYTNPSFINIGKVQRVINREQPRIIYMSQGLQYRYCMDIIIKFIKRLYPEPDITIQLHPEEEEFISEYRLQRSFQLPTEYDLVIGYNSTMQLKSLVMGVPTIFMDKNILVNLEYFKQGLPVIIDPLYEEFQMCTNEDYFIDQTKLLLSIIRKQINTIS